MRFSEIFSIFFLFSVPEFSNVKRMKNLQIQQINEVKFSFCCFPLLLMFLFLLKIIWKQQVNLKIYDSKCGRSIIRINNSVQNHTLTNCKKGDLINSFCYRNEIFFHRIMTHFFSGTSGISQIFKLHDMSTMII